MFYDNYVRICQDKGVSPSKAALDMGIHKSSVTRWRDLKSTPNGETLKKIADYFKIPVQYLLYGPEYLIHGGLDEDGKPIFSAAPSALNIDLGQLFNGSARMVMEEREDGQYITFKLDDDKITVGEFESALAVMKKIQEKMGMSADEVMKLAEDKTPQQLRDYYKVMIGE